MSERGPEVRRGPEEDGDPRLERLLEQLAGARSDAERARVRAELDGDSELAEAGRHMDQLVTGARRLAESRAEELAPMREARLVGRILSRTTREDLSWRGDWRLWRGFFSERLASSNALRWVAASLVVHLFALPFFGTEIFRKERRPVAIKFELSPAEGEFQGLDPVPEPPAPSWDPEEGLPPGAIENALRRGHYCLSRVTPLVLPTSAEGLAAPLELRLLAERSRGLGHRGSEGALAAWVRNGEGLETAGALSTSLWAQALLDGYCLRGEQPPALAFVLSRLAGLEGAGGAPAGVELALQRARAYGLWEAPRGFDVRAARDPFSAAELQALARELGPGEPPDWLAPWLP